MNPAQGRGGGGGQFLSGVDFYRRVPRDLTESTSLGAWMSLTAIAIMGLLFVSESLAFARSKIVTSITLDEDTQPQMRVNFNLTFLDLHCDYVAVDVLDALGTNRQNVTKNVEKWQLDSDGNRRIFSGRNRETREVLYETHDPEQDDQAQYTASELDQANFSDFLRKHELVFIDFYAPWCMWCQRLHPTWQKLASAVQQDQMPVGIAQVNCVTQADLCRDQKIQAFPTLRWYRDSQPEYPEYKQDRTVAALTGFVKRKLEMNDKYKNWEQKAAETGDPSRSPKRPIGRPDHPGCQISGHLMVNRVPGNFHVEARSKNHNLNAAMTNLTHRVNHLSFGEPVLAHHRKEKRILKQVPEEYKQFSPIDGHTYLTDKYHQAYHHYIKVVSTQLDMSGNGKDDSGDFTGVNAIITNDNYNFMSTYQFLEQSQLVFYDDLDVPEARFSYDISPMSVLVQKENRKWYDYLTSLCAILGGTFTTLGLIDATLYRALKAKKQD